ncbi:MAG: hypothetical protein Kow0058_06300 [Roseovarius sp.]
MDIDSFMAAYKRVWEGQDSEGFAALFTESGEYWNTPFQVQRDFAARKTYWDRIKLQDKITLAYEVLARSASGGIAHWHVSYQVASEELFAIWARSAGTGLPERQPGDPLPWMELDGVLSAEFDDDDPKRRARVVRIWWHSLPRPAG